MAVCERCSEMAQPIFPVFPAPSADESIHVWARRWLSEHYPGQVRFNREQLREEMLRDLPLRFVLEAHPENVWWQRRFQDVTRALGLVFPGGREGTEVVVQRALPFDEFAAHSIQRLRLALADIQAVERDLQEYVAFHGLTLDVPATVQAWKAAAGL